MIPDTDKGIIEAYGAREVLGMTAKRKTFLIAPDGTIARTWPNVRLEDHAADVLGSIAAIVAFTQGADS